MGNRLQAWLRVAAVGAGVAALDQTTKQIASAVIGHEEHVDVLFGFGLVDVRNEGIAFGLLAGGEVLVALLTLGVLALLLAYFALNVARPGVWVAVGLLTGGALSNLADRVRIGGVIDLLDPPLWPAFNLADVAIVVGLGWLVVVLGVWQPGDREADRHQGSDATG